MKNAIFILFFKKISKLNYIIFLILQKVYKIVLGLFNIIFIAIIDTKYYFRYYQEKTKIILYKSGKNRTILKEYCTITLVNCLAKITKRIIATRIAYLAENSLYSKNILNYKQIENKKQKLAINAITNLIHDIQIINNRDNILSCLLIDVKEAFNSISFT